ncbi:MAG: spore protease YyaC [Clostridia bacterium]
MEMIFLCIGSDKIIGDCFGPLVGTKLLKKLEPYNTFNIQVYGNLERTISYENIEQYQKQINENPYDTCIIVIDAALSKKENIGNIYVSKEKTILGKGLHKNKIAIGDISIKAVVGKDFKVPSYNFTMLQNVSLNLVMHLADMVADSIFEVIEYL